MRIQIMAFSLLVMVTFPVYAKDINSDLSSAAEKGDTATVQALLDKGADVNAKSIEGTTPLMKAAREGHMETVQALINKGADVNIKNECCDDTALLWAAGKGHTKIVKALLDKGADINAKNFGGYTALMRAVEFGHTPTVQTLIDKGVDVNIKHDDKTALLLAEEDNHTEIIKLLKAAGAK